MREMSPATASDHCIDRFECVSAMILHLESDMCPSESHIDLIDDLAFQCEQSHRYTNRRQDYYKYQCPDCGTQFTKLSALLQHAECEACEADVGKSPFCEVLHFLSLYFND